MTSPRDTYTHGHHESVLASHTWRTIANSSAYLLPHLATGLDLLDLGCGPGNITNELAGRVAPGKVVGVDLGTEVIDAANATYATTPNLSFAVDDAYSLSFDDGSFDIVHSHQVLQHVSDPVAVIREAARVCRPNGLIAVRDADYAGMFWYPQIEGLDAWMSTYRQTCHLNHAEPDAGRHLLHWAAEAGLDDVTATASIWCFATPRDREWWSSLWSTRVLESSFAAQAVEYGLASNEELTQMSTAWIEWGAHPHAWFVVPHSELLIRL